MKKLIITADDFGLCEAVNEGVEEAHLRGVLNTASLMAGARATRDAMERARRLPSLRLGLHLVLSGGTCISPPPAIPSLVDPKGEFSSCLFRSGVNFFFRPGVRQELEREIRAQFQAFQDTGFDLDHVNCHNHLHLHPTIGALILKIGRGFGMRAVRFPYEPVLPSWGSGRAFGRKVSSFLFLCPWLAILKSRLRRARVRSNQFIFGLNDSGDMNLDRVLRMLRHLPSGVSEIYFHPASRRCPEIDRRMKNYRCEEELAALTSPLFRQALADLHIQRVSFSDIQIP